MITDRERSLANLCSTRSRRELSNQVNFESMRAIPILTDGQTFAPRHYRASIDPVHGSRAQQREMPMVRRSEGEKNGNTSESSVHSVFYHARGERSRAMVLGGVLGGFGGGNQSGKKLNITPEERGRVSVAETLVSRAFGGHQRNGLEGGCGTYSPAWSHGYPGQITS